VSRGPWIGAPIVAIGLAVLGSVAALTAASSSTQALERVLAKSNEPAPPAYRALRRLEGGVTGADKRGWLEAWTEYRPGVGLTFEVVREGGTEYVRNKILRRMLESEQQLLASGRRVRASLESKNYQFEDGGRTEAGLQRIILKPAKKSDGIVSGSAFLDPETGLVTTIQGRLVKSPSFWLRDVDVTWTFGHINGYVVPLEMSSTGRVRMFGRSNFKMVYQYESIDGQPAAVASR